MLFLHKIVSVFNTFPDRNAFCIQDRHYTYSELESRVSAIQLTLTGKFKDEQRIGVLLSDHIDTYAAILAVLLSGKTYIPIHPGHPADRTELIIQQADLKVIFSIFETIPFPSVEHINTTVLAGNNQPVAATGEDILRKNAYILFTSGSTGVPKGTPISYHNLNSFTEAFFNLGYQLDEQDRFLQMFDLTFDLSVMSYLIPMCLGACVYTIPEKGVKFTSIYGILDKYNITFILMVPSILSYLRPYFPEISLPALRYSLFCGEALLTDIVSEWAMCVPNAIIENVYGPTEATIFCLTYRVAPKTGILDNNGIVTIGKPMDNMEAIIVDEDRNELHDGSKGELCLFGNQVTEGYLSEEKNKEAFFLINGKKYYRTGDIATKLPDGNFNYCGRIDHQVKIQGFRVELSEVEHHVRTIVNGPNAVALAIEAGSQGLNQIEIVIESVAMNTEELLQTLKTKLPSYMMPANVHYINPFPLNVNGKTDRKALKNMII